MWMVAWYSCASSMGFQLRGGLSPTSSVTPYSSSLLYINPSSSFTLMDEFCQGTGDKLQFCNKDSGSVMRDTFSPPQENCGWRRIEYYSIFIARGGTCLLSIYMQVPLTLSWWTVRQIFCIYNIWILTSILSILQCKNTLIPLLQIWKLPFTLESKTCSKDFIFVQFNLFRESSIYDLNWAVHSDKSWSPRNSCN